jgi:endonuclease/exonuclease/phosphatase family metal-dependent hydrolase
MKLLQWNIWYKEDINNILSTLKEINADIVCLQELTINHPHHNQEIDIPQYIADGLDFSFFFKEAQRSISDGQERKYGNGIFSRYPIVQSDFRYIQEPQDPDIQDPDYSKEGRVYVEALINTGDRQIIVGATHMSYTDRFVPTPEKEAETEKLIEVLKEKKSNFIFTGDLNSLPGSRTINEISKLLKNAGPSLEESTWTTKPFSYNGFDANTLDWRIDYCFVTPDVKIKSAKIFKTEYSDHLPILLEI